MLEDLYCNRTWYYLDTSGSGTPVRCGPTNGTIECATWASGKECQWGRIFNIPEAYQPLHGVISGPPMVKFCPTFWKPNDASDACAVLGCYEQPASRDFCRPAQPLPAAAVRSSWLWTLFIDGEGHVTLSENKYHEDVFLVDWFLWTLVALGVLCCLCCLVGCVLRCSMRRTFTRLTRIEKRLRYELAMTKVRAGEPLDEEEAAAAAGSPPDDVIAKADKETVLPSWDVMFVKA